MEIVAAILESNFKNLYEKLFFLSSIKNKYALDIKKVQIDLCDGIFVENETWIPSPTDQKEVEQILYFKNIFDIEYHIMCKDQLNLLKSCDKLSAKSVVVHIDDIFYTNDLKEVVCFAKDNFIKLYICSRLDFVLENRENIASFLYQHGNIDLQIMGIDKIGTQGQEFDERCIEAIKFFRKNFSKGELGIQIDGGVNKSTFAQCREAGASSAVVGSYLMKNVDEVNFVTSYKNLKRL